MVQFFATVSRSWVCCLRGSNPCKGGDLYELCPSWWRWLQCIFYDSPNNHVLLTLFVFLINTCTYCTYCMCFPITKNHYYNLQWTMKDWKWYVFLVHVDVPLLCTPVVRYIQAYTVLMPRHRVGSRPGCGGPFAIALLYSDCQCQHLAANQWQDGQWWTS